MDPLVFGIMAPKEDEKYGSSDETALFRTVKAVRNGVVEAEVSTECRVFGTPMARRMVGLVHVRKS